VRGIGPKTAVELLHTYDSLDGVYAHLDDVRPIVREKLKHDREQAFFCQRMVQLICDMALPVALDDLKLTGLPTDQIIAFFTEMEFTLLTKRFQQLLAMPFGKAHFAQSAQPLPTVRSDNDQLALF
jgi:DNA polymerase-1